MKKFILVLVMLLASVTVTYAQGPKLAWDQRGGSLALVNSYTYKYYTTASPDGINISDVVCTGSIQPYTCMAPVPSFPSGITGFQMTASSTFAESLKSVLYSFNISTPTNIRIAILNHINQIMLESKLSFPFNKS